VILTHPLYGVFYRAMAASFGLIVFGMIGSNLSTVSAFRRGLVYLIRLGTGAFAEQLEHTRRLPASPGLNLQFTLPPRSYESIPTLVRTACVSGRFPPTPMRVPKSI